MALTTIDDIVDADNFGCVKQVVTKKRPEGGGGVPLLVVKFKETVQVRATTHGKSDQQILEDKNAKWYSQHELLKMRKRHIQLILALDTVSENEREVLKNVYGIDSVESRNVRQDRIRSVRLAVLQEQEKQWDLQTMDETKLASTAHLASIIATKEAQLRGIQVMREVVRDTIQDVQSGPTVGRAKTNMVCDSWSLSSSPFRHPKSSTRNKAGRSSLFRWTGQEGHDSSRFRKIINT